MLSKLPVNALVPMKRALMAPVKKQLFVQHTSNLFVDEYEKVIPSFYVRPAAPILALNGNIGRTGSIQTWAFLSHCSRNWDQTLYVPGALEVGDDNLTHLKEICDSFRNVKLLNRDTYTCKKHDTIFVGATLQTGYGNTLLDRYWFLNEFETWKSSSSKLVALTHGVPHQAMLMSNTLSDLDIGELYPVFNAWLSAGIGGKTIRFRNNVVGSVNGRGTLLGMMRGLPKGWSKSATVRIPENHEVDEGFVSGVY